MPHSLNPVMDKFRPSDIDFLRNSGYNLGYIGLSKGNQSIAMLD